MPRVSLMGVWMFFVAVTLGLIAGGGVETLMAPVEWTASGVIAARDVIPAQVCVVGALS